MPSFCARLVPALYAIYIKIVYKMHGSGAEEAVPACHAGACCNQKFLKLPLSGLGVPTLGCHLPFSGFLPVTAGA
ncbi:hypothetical protein [Polaromonas sp. P5_E6]